MTPFRFASFRNRLAALPAFLIAASVFLAPASRADDGARQMDAARLVYRGKMEQANKDYTEGIESLMGKYTKALKDLQGRLQKSGDLQGVLQVNEELERLSIGSAPPEEGAFAEHAKLLDLQKTCTKAAANLELAKSRKIVAAVGEYTTHLEAEKKRLTIAGDFEAAKTYAAEVERIKKSAEELAAAKHLQESRKQTASTQSKKPTSAATKAVGYTRCKIYPGRGAPAIKEVEFEDQSLVGTRQVGSLTEVSASATLGNRSNMTESERRSSYSSSKTSSGEVEVIARVTLKTRSPEAAIANPLVLVQYFGADVGARGLKKPEQIAAEPVRLNALTDKEVTIEFPPVSLRKYEYRYRSSYSRHTSKSGKEFYGIMVTIFDENKKVVYQSVNNSSLRDHGDLATGAAATAEKSADVDSARRAYEEARDAYHDSLRTGENREQRMREYHEARDHYYKVRNLNRD